LPGHEKLLKKVEQERAKGQHDRALARLKEAIAEDPREFSLAQEAASLCFALGRTLEGANVLRSALKRCPEERPFALEMLEREFATAHSAELGEILYESYLAVPDFDRAREVVSALAEGDRSRLLAKLRTKLTSVTEEAPNDAPRLVGLLLAEAVVLSAMQQSDEFASTLEHALDLEPALNDTVGRLSKLELRQAPECGRVHLLLIRCYLNIQKLDGAAEHAVAAGRDAALRGQALQLLDGAGDSSAVALARGELLLREGRFDDAHAVLQGLLESDPAAAAVVRSVFEAALGSGTGTPALRLLHAVALARTNAHRPALKELQEAIEAGADPQAALATADILQAEDAHGLDLMVVRGRCAIAVGDAATASAAFKQVLATDPSRAGKLREEIEAAAAKESDGTLERVLVDLYLQLELPVEASAALRRARYTHAVPPATVYEFAFEIAGRYGFSAPLLLVAIEAALETEHVREAHAAVAHYLKSPGAHTAEFALGLGALLQERPELAPRAARALQGLPLPVELRLPLVTANLDGDAPGDAVVQIETIVLERPELRGPALDALESFLTRHPDQPDALLLAGELAEGAGKVEAAMQHLSHAVRVVPAETDRIAKVAEKVLRRAPHQASYWRDLVLALVDAGRHRHARELCYLAQQTLPVAQQGFVHAALGEMLLAAQQQQPGVSELESSLACEDVPVERVVALLERVVQADARHGYGRYVLAAALLRQGTDYDVALVHLSQAVQQDDLLVDLAAELLADYADKLENHAPARVLEGLLLLRRGDRERGVAMLDRALQLQPQIAAQVLPPLEAEWDRDAQNAGVGLTFARALRAAGHARRACRLVTDLAHRFPERQDELIAELESMLDGEALADAHRALWEVLLDRGEAETALPHLQHAVAETHEPDAMRELLEVALRRMPDTPWVVCRMAEFECGNDREARAEELLRGLLSRDPAQGPGLLDCVRALPESARTQGLRLLEIDCLLAGQQGAAALEALHRFRAGYPEERAVAMERYRLLADQKSAGLAVECELGGLLREAGLVDDAVVVLQAGLARAAAVGNTTGDDARAERELRLVLAQMYVELGRDSDSKELLATVLDRPGDHQETYGFLERLSHQGMLSRLKSLRESIAIQPGNLRARLEVARLSIVSMDFDAARAALSFSGDSPLVEAARLYLLARTHADEDHPELALAVLRSIELDDVADEELRRNVVYLKGVCCEQIGQNAEAHALFLQLLSEFPYFKDTRERVRRTYQKHLEAALGSRAEVLEKRTHLDVT
jgi:tetratricopeptide (TPR) repeat protein